jgi:hypothetical protein
VARLLIVFIRLMVDMHPTRIRCPSMFLPHYIGNGWYGGLMTTIAAATVAQIGDMNYGLWCPFVIAADTFVFGLWFVRKTMRMGNDADD